MLSEESEKSRQRRILNRFMFVAMSVTFTLTLYALDAYIMFSTTLATVKHKDVTVSFGPLYTKLCSNQTTTMTQMSTTETMVDQPYKPINKCTKVLFYQMPVDDYFGPEVQRSSDIMVATWIPMLFGLIASRFALYRIHCLLQLIVSLGYSGLMYLLIFRTMDSAEPGMSVTIILIRFSTCLVCIILMIIMSAIKAMTLRCCPDISLEPILIGHSFNDDTAKDDVEDMNVDLYYSDDDVLSQRFWSSKKERYSPVE